MSFHRENVVWQSRDGTWALGFFDFWCTGDDPEWDVDYNFDAFHWVSTGHPTEEAARQAWTGANPGGGTLVTEPNDETDKYDAMAKTCQARMIFSR